MDSIFLDKLRTIAGPEGVITGADLAARSAGAFREDLLRAGALVRPRNTEEVAAVLRLCHQRGQTVVTQGGLTGLVHGADAEPRDLILSLERMRTIEQVDALQRIAVVQAGVPLQALQEAAEAADLSFPLDLGARGSATLGGNAATNAGGNRVIRYGMTRDMVLGLEAVLADGTVVSSMNRLIKNNAGYDLKQLFLGTEGTLGVITRLVVRLRERPRSQNVALVALPSFTALAAFLKHMDRHLGGNLSAFEAMWSDFYQLVTSPPASHRPPLPQVHAYYVLVEALGGDQAADEARFSASLAAAQEHGLIVDAVLAASDRERKSLWALRDDVTQLFRFGPVFTFDVSVPMAATETYVAQVRASLAERFPQHRCWVFGHLGDGNVHLAVQVDQPTPEIRHQAEAAVYEPLAAIGGSISAEHGVGLEKKPWLHLCRSPSERALMGALKQALDPKGILNSGKVV